MPDAAMDLDAYLRRIAHTGDRSPTLATLHAVIARHAAAIPFENLDSFAGVVPALYLAALQAKLVDGGRGGWCFEQNLLLRAALLALGYKVTALAARVLWGGPADAVTRRSHMLLLVEVAGERRIVDVGFGGMVLTGSLDLDCRELQQTPLAQFRIVDLAVGGSPEYAQQVLLGGQWRATYRFDLQPQRPIDYETENWYLATWPSSHFIANLMLARATPERRYALGGRALTIRHADGTTERHTLRTAAELRGRLAEDFGIDPAGLAALPGLDTAFDRLPG